LTESVDRRGFLKGAGAAVAGAAVLAGASGKMQMAADMVLAVSIDEKPYEIDPAVYRPMSQANTCFSRMYRGDPTIEANPAAWFGANPMAHIQKGDPGYGYLDYAFQIAAQAVGAKLAFTGSTYDYRGETLGYSFPDKAPKSFLGLPPYEVRDPVAMSRHVKKAARFFGASVAGVCAVDPRWIYSDVLMGDTGEVKPLDFPRNLTNAVVMAFEMDYDAIVTSPTALAAGAVAHAYSRQDSAALYVAEFIKTLGYEAVAAGNDTSLSVPLAIDAGIGETSRSGLLITPQFGPRVRLSKVFTNLPLAPDKPIKFGVREFCRVCLKCAEKCPSQSISMEADPTWSGPSKSNNPGVLKWYVNVDTCLKFWSDNGVDCVTCIASCPYNKPADMWHHQLGAVAARSLGKAWVSLDNALGYGEQRDPVAWWDKEQK